MQATIRRTVDDMVVAFAVWEQNVSQECQDYVFSYVYVMNEIDKSLFHAKT